MTWKRVSITIFLLIVFLNILQINIFLLFVNGSQSQDEPGSGLSSEAISAIWWGELVLGLSLLIGALIYLIISKRKKGTKTPKVPFRKPKANVAFTITTGFNHVSPYYKVEIENKGEMPIIDVMFRPILSEESFRFDKKVKKISLVRSQGMRTVKFSMKPKKGKSGVTDVSCHVKYYNVANDEYEEQPLKSKTVKINWPVFRKTKLEIEEWEGVKEPLLSGEESVNDIPLSGLECTKLIKDIVKRKNLYKVSSDVQNDPFKSTWIIYGEDEDNLKYGAELRITSSERDKPPSRLKMISYGEKKENIAGFYYTIINEIDSIIEREKKKEEAAKSAKADLPEISKMVMAGVGSQRDLFQEFDRLRNRVETIEKDKIGIDSKYTSLYELDELYKILAEDLVKRRIIDVKAGEEIVKKRLEQKYLDELKRFDEAFALLCEAETSDSLLMRKDFPDSGKKAILLVYFNAVEVYVRDRLKELVPKGVTILLGESHGHINTRKKDWERSWSVLGLGSCIHIINRNKYIFLKNEKLWKQKVETLMHQVREMRNVVAHPSTENPEPEFVREKVYRLLTLLPNTLKSKKR
jgi:hypothetical protein